MCLIEATPLGHSLKRNQTDPMRYAKFIESLSTDNSYS